MIKNDPKVINAWCMYDWSVSVYNLTIVSSIFPIYFSHTAVNPGSTDLVDFLGFEIKNSVLFSYALSFTFMLIAFFSPILTAIADYSGRKKMFMRFFCLVGSLACSMMYFFQDGSDTTFVVGLFILAGMGFSGSFVFYNAYLPEIATEDRFDRISARGFSMGYIGSVLHLIFCLSMLLKPEWYGNIDSGLAARISFLLVGIWWFGFAQITFFFLPKDKSAKAKEKNWIFNGFKELKKVFKQVKTLPNLKRYLLAFFFYNMGVQTVMYVATIFAEKELRLPSSNLITTILLLQLIAIPGAIISSRISMRWGNIVSIFIQLFVWIGITIAAYFVRNGIDFYVLACVVGLVMGGIQSISRSTYSKLIPENTTDNASFFSFYEVVDKMGIVLGTFSYGLLEAVTGSARNSVITLGIFFILSLIFLKGLFKWNKSLV